MYPITPFDLAEQRDAQFVPWVDAGTADLAKNAFFKRGFYYTRVEEHGMFAGTAELKAFDAPIEAFPVDKYMIVTAGEVTITCAKGRVTKVAKGGSCVIPRGLNCRWSQPAGTRIFFMLYAGPSPGPANAADLSVLVPNPKDELSPLPPPSAELLLSSPPPVTGRKLVYTDPSGRFVVGMWDATAYTRKLNAIADYELMYLTEGKVTLTNAVGESRTFGPGETLIVDRGISNMWKSDDYVRKIYCKVLTKRG